MIGGEAVGLWSYRGDFVVAVVESTLIANDHYIGVQIPTTVPSLLNTAVNSCWTFNAA